MLNQLKQISSIIQKTTTLVLLHVAYVVGIGVTSGIGKLLHTPFLSQESKKTNWVKHKISGSIKTMY